MPRPGDRRHRAVGNKEIIDRLNSYSEVSPSGPGSTSSSRACCRQGSLVVELIRSRSMLPRGSRRSRATGWRSIQRRSSRAQEALEWLLVYRLGKNLKPSQDGGDTSGELPAILEFPQAKHEAPLDLAEVQADVERQAQGRQAATDGRKQFVKADGSPDLSDYDFALAILARQVRWNEAEIIALVRGFRAKQGDPKGERSDYVLGTCARRSPGSMRNRPGSASTIATCSVRPLVPTALHGSLLVPTMPPRPGPRRRTIARSFRWPPARCTSRPTSRPSCWAEPSGCCRSARSTSARHCW